MSWGRKSRMAWRGVGALALAVCWATMPAATQARAQVPSSGPTIELDIGYAGQYEPGAPILARVLVKAPRLIDGDLVLDSGRSKVTREIEVAGGSVKEFLLLLPTSPFERSVGMTATVRKGKTVVTSVNDRVTYNQAEEPVGLLPGAAGSGEIPGAVPLSIDIGTARFARVTPAELDLAPESLAPLTTIAAAAGETTLLSAEQRAGLLQWVHLGGRLLVDEAPGTPIPGLDGIDTTGDGRASLGYGEVVAANGVVSAGRWLNVIEPSERWDAQSRGESGMISDLVAMEANIRQAGLGGLSIFLLLYVFLVGPVMFFVLRRSGQRQWAWLGIPGVALVFTIGAYVLGRDLRSNARPAHASILLSTPSGSLARSWVGVNSTRGGTAKIEFPRQWTVQPNSFNGEGATLEELIDRADGLEARVPLGPGEFGLVEARGAVRREGGLELIAISGNGSPDGMVSGTIRNSHPFAVDSVRVVVGSSVTDVGSLAPGQNAEWSAPVPSGQFGGQPISDQIAGPNSFLTGGGGFDRASFSRRGLVSEAQYMQGWTDATATVSAYGWTTEYSPPVEVGSTRKLRGSTLVVGLAAVQGGFADTSTARLLRGSMFEGMGVMGDRGRQGSEVVLRVDVPPTVNAGAALLEAPQGGAQPEVWMEGRWQPIGQAGDSANPEPDAQPDDEVIVEAVPAPPMVACPAGAKCVSRGVAVGGRGFRAFGGSITAAVPAKAIVNGRVFVRLNGILQPFGMGQVRIR